MHTIIMTSHLISYQWHMYSSRGVVFTNQNHSPILENRGKYPMTFYIYKPSSYLCKPLQNMNRLKEGLSKIHNFRKLLKICIILLIYRITPKIFKIYIFPPFFIPTVPYTSLHKQICSYMIKHLWNPSIIRSKMCNYLCYPVSAAQSLKNCKIWIPAKTGRNPRVFALGRRVFLAHFWLAEGIFLSLQIFPHQK